MPYLVQTLATLRAEYNRAFPTRDKSKDGWIGDTAHAARKSDHNPDAAGRVKAVDITAAGARGRELADVAIAALKRRGQAGYVIHAGRIANPSIKGGAWRPYTGPNPHNGHVHVSAHSMLASTDAWGVKRVTAPRVTGRLDTPTVLALQALVGVYRDGVIGKQTITALQRFLIKHGHPVGKAGADGDFGNDSARALESFLGLKVEKIRGWYPGLTRGLQRYLADLVKDGVL